MSHPIDHAWFVSARADPGGTSMKVARRDWELASLELALLDIVRRVQLADDGFVTDETRDARR